MIGNPCPSLTSLALLGHTLPMNGNGDRSKQPDWRAAAILGALMSDRGWNAVDVERASGRSGVGHPMRRASQRTVYRVLKGGYVPSRPSQFEIAAVWGLLPSHLWGGAALPEPYAYLNDTMVAVA